MVTVLKNRNKKVNEAISMCLSSSQICGHELRKAHYYLGTMIGKQILKDCVAPNEKIAVLIMMRAGLPFGMGVSDSIEKRNDVTVLFSTLDNDFSKFDTVIIADAVVNTGKTILEIATQLKDKKVIVATNVISDKYLDNLKEIVIFATRISTHSYVGSNVKKIEKGKGPDTGERLFNNYFYNN